MGVAHYRLKSVDMCRWPVCPAGLFRAESFFSRRWCQCHCVGGVVFCCRGSRRDESIVITSKAGAIVAESNPCLQTLTLVYPILQGIVAWRLRERLFLRRSTVSLNEFIDHALARRRA